jgi:calcineurin-like phosphoesterase family protein
MSKIWITSDSHFNSLSTIVKENRPYKTANAFDKAVIGIWNNQVEEEDAIYCLGDFSYYVNDLAKTWRVGLGYVQYINCDVILIIGGEEEKIIKEYFKNDFNSFRNYCLTLGFRDVLKDKILEVDDKVYYLNHYPSKHKKGCINLFGHVHRAAGIYAPFGLNMCCDLNHYSLYDLEGINELMETSEKFWKTDKELQSIFKG